MKPPIGARLMEIYDAFPKEIRDFIKEYEHQGDTNILVIESMLFGAGMSAKHILDRLKRTIEEEGALSCSIEPASRSGEDSPSPPQTKNWQQSLQKAAPSISTRPKEGGKSP